eukprot:1941180-Amphidinium_carterae.1
MRPFHTRQVSTSKWREPRGLARSSPIKRCWQRHNGGRMKGHPVGMRHVTPLHVPKPLDFFRTTLGSTGTSEALLRSEC